MSVIFFGIALTEGILRLFPDLLSPELQKIVVADPDNYGVAHNYIGNLGTPNQTYVQYSRDYRVVVHTDGYGFRNPWPWPKKADIVVVGDSQAYGTGVNDNQTWPAIVAKALPQTDVINLGMIGAGAQQSLRIYETFGIALHPKILFVSFSVGDDFWDDDRFDQWLKSGAAVNYMVWRDFGHPKSTRLTVHQNIGDLVRSVLWRGHLVASKSRFYNFLIYARKVIKGHGFSYPTMLRSRDGMQLHLNLENFVQNSGMDQDLSVKALQRLDSITKANGTQTIVILQPSKEEVYLPLIGQTNRDPDPGKALRAKLDGLGIPYLDLLPVFRNRAAKGQTLFFETDGHPNVTGYALIAHLVIDHLRKTAKSYNVTDSEARPSR